MTQIWTKRLLAPYGKKVICGEFELIKHIQEILGPPGPNILTAIGDDTAVVLPPKENLVATVDMQVEGTHFDLSYINPEELGHKALAVNLSDMAATGACPLYALVSLGIRTDLEKEFFSSFYQGLKTLGDKFSTQVIGGNIAKCPNHLVIDITVLGEVCGKGLVRGGAKPGDLVAISGPVGLSSAGRQMLVKYPDARKTYPELVKAHLKPEPRIFEALTLSKTGMITSMIDISDGLSSELGHLSQKSGVQIRVDSEKIPLPPSLVSAAKAVDADSWEWVLHGGEDYELLFTFKAEGSDAIAKALDSHGRKLLVIGSVTGAGSGVEIEKDGKIYPLKPMGWDHLNK